MFATIRMWPIRNLGKETPIRSHFQGISHICFFRAFIALLAAPLVWDAYLLHHPDAFVQASPLTQPVAIDVLGTAVRDSSGAEWSDSLGDGFPDGARLESGADRENFTRWFTFLAETQYYVSTPAVRAEVQDCAALVRFAYRNALEPHSPSWRERAGLPFDPGFGEIASLHYPFGPLGEKLFRVQPGPLAPGDFEQGAFSEFADSATLLRYNTYPISRDLRGARPGDLLFFHQSVQHEPFHTMIFVGKSHYQPQGADWIVYHTGDLNGHRGEIREVRAGTLIEHPDLHWRPLLSNPNFIGVYRLEILR